MVSSNQGYGAEELWSLAEERFCNVSHQQQMRTSFNKMTWREGKERLNNFAHRVRAAALALLEPVSDDTLLDRFIHSLPSGLRELAIPVPGSFDEVARRVTMMSASMAAEARKGRYRGERVRKIEE